VRIIKKRLGKNNARVTLLSIGILDMAVDNCIESFKREVASRDFMSELVKIVTKKNADPQVRLELLKLIARWTEVHGEDSQFVGFKEAFLTLQRGGYYGTKVGSKAPRTTSQNAAQPVAATPWLSSSPSAHSYAQQHGYNPLVPTDNGGHHQHQQQQQHYGHASRPYVPGAESMVGGGLSHRSMSAAPLSPNTVMQLCNAVSDTTTLTQEVFSDYCRSMAQVTESGEVAGGELLDELTENLMEAQRKLSSLAASIADETLLISVVEVNDRATCLISTMAQFHLEHPPRTSETSNLELPAQTPPSEMPAAIATAVSGGVGAQALDDIDFDMLGDLDAVEMEDLHTANDEVDQETVVGYSHYGEEGLQEAGRANTHENTHGYHPEEPHAMESLAVESTQGDQRNSSSSNPPPPPPQSSTASGTTKDAFDILAYRSYAQ
jgi:hypothetical protein